MMIRLLSLVLVAFLLAVQIAAQPQDDVCHVYLIDVAVAKKAIENFKPSGDSKKDAKALEVGVTVFPNFETEISEETFTTRHFRFPNQNLFITASVYYTDDSMASRMGEEGELTADSMLLGVVITRKKVQNAIFEVENNVVSEVTYDNTLSKIRVKKNLTLNKRLYIVGLECDCNAKREKVKR